MSQISLAPPLAMKPRKADTPCKIQPTGLSGDTLVRTIMGLRPVARLMAGDLILNAQGQIIELRSLRTAKLRKADCVAVDASACGFGLAPGTHQGTWIIGAGQKLAMRDWRSDVLFGKPALTAAATLVDEIHVRPADKGATVYQLAFDSPQVIEANGYKTLIPQS